MISRENKLLQLVHLLWPYVPATIEPELREHLYRQNMGWAVPPDPYAGIDAEPEQDRLLTVDELAAQLGYKPSTIRVWAHRYEIESFGGRYWQSDVDAALAIRARTPRKPREKKAA